MIEHGFLDALPDLFTSTCTIQENTPVTNDAGVSEDNWTNLDGHGEIPCQVSVIGGFFAGGSEIDRGDGTHVRFDRLVSLKGHFPTLTEKHRAVVDGVTFDIETVDHHSQGIYSRLSCRIVR